MNKLTKEKTDVVSVILDDHDLLSAFTDSLKVDQTEEFTLSNFSENSFGRFQKLKLYLWKKAKEIMKLLSNKIQILVILTEYNLKIEEKKQRSRYDDL
jgi:hypothetical protein